jgi:hypothetical protein
MERSYGVVWREGARSSRSGKLELLPRSLRLEGRDGSTEVPYEGVAAVRVGRLAPDRIDGRPSIIVERRTGAPIAIATVAQQSVVSEIAERLAALQLGARTTHRLVVVVPLKPGAQPAVSALLEKGPPFDPVSVAALDRHEVFLTSDEAVFVFESREGIDALAPQLMDSKIWAAADEWRELVAGAPRIAEDTYSWARTEPPEDASFLPTPGPGYSEGGEIY